MEVKELRIQTGLSQSKFAKMFDVPVATLKDWEHSSTHLAKLFH